MGRAAGTLRVGDGLVTIEERFRNNPYTTVVAWMKDAEVHAHGSRTWRRFRSGQEIPQCVGGSYEVWQEAVVRQWKVDVRPSRERVGRAFEQRQRLMPTVHG
jgi:hypothetical protein